jgi:hypothetical protein
LGLLAGVLPFLSGRGVRPAALPSFRPTPLPTWYGPAVFWRLGHLKPGDALGEGGQPRLSLITCAGEWDGSEYSQRLVVEATLG